MTQFVMQCVICHCVTHARKMEVLQQIARELIADSDDDEHEVAKQNEWNGQLASLQAAECHGKLSK